MRLKISLLYVPLLCEGVLFLANYTWAFLWMAFFVVCLASLDLIMTRVKVNDLLLGIWTVVMLAFTNIVIDLFTHLHPTFTQVLWYCIGPVVLSFVYLVLINILMAITTGD